jgi:hypothetical protein
MGVTSDNATGMSLESTSIGLNSHKVDILCGH